MTTTTTPNYSNYTIWYSSFTTEVLAQDPTPPNPILDPLLGVITLLLVVFGAPANLISLLYFLKKSGSNASTMIYRLMNVVDLLICIILIPIGINYFNPSRKDRPYFFNIEAFCNIWSILWNTSIRLSIYLIGVMSTARAISLIKPLYYLRRAAVVTPFAIYSVFLLVQQTLPYWFRRDAVRYYNIMGICTWTFADIVPLFSMGHKMCDFFFIQLEFLIPVIPIVISSVISIIKLHGKRKLGIAQASNKNRKHATVTIIILTVIFVLLNTPFLVYQFFQSVTILSDGVVSPQWDGSINIKTRKVLAHIYNIHLIGLNSCINPIIYFIRIKELRVHVLSPNKWRVMPRRGTIDRSMRVVNRPAIRYNGTRNNIIVRDDDVEQVCSAENGTFPVTNGNGYTLVRQDRFYGLSTDTPC